MSRRLSANARRRLNPALDLFGEVVVSRDDVYAWLLEVVDLDPASHRAFDYVRAYQVLDRIVRAKLDGTFDALTQPRRHSARLRELQAQGPAVHGARNTLGLGETTQTSAGGLRSLSLRAKARPVDVLRDEQQAKARRKSVREQMLGSPLARMPDAIPPLSVMLEDLANPSPAVLAHVLGVSERAAAGWIKAGEAPKVAMQALFWLTRWGQSQVDCLAKNDAIAKASEAAGLRAELEQLREQLQRVGRIGEFGSANDPVPAIPVPTDSEPAWEADESGLHVTWIGVPLDERTSPTKRRKRVVAQPRDAGAEPLVFTSIRSAPCAAASRNKKRA